MKKFFKLFIDLNLVWTLYLNFKYFAFRDALKFPLFIHGRLYVHSAKGKIIINGPVKAGMVRLGESRVGLFDGNIRTVLNIHGQLIFNGSSRIGRGSSLSIGPSSRLLIGNDFIITAKCSIVASEGKDVYIGNNCLISWDVLIMNTDFHKLIDIQSENIINNAADVKIGDKVWIGYGVTILKGTIIPDNSVIASNSTCSGKFLDRYSVYAGVPAKKIKSNISWNI